MVIEGVDQRLVGLPQQIVEHWLPNGIIYQERPDEVANLSEYDLELLRFAAQGLSSGEIAGHYGHNDDRTIRGAYDRLREPIGALNKSHAVYLALRAGAVDPTSIPLPEPLDDTIHLPTSRQDQVIRLGALGLTSQQTASLLRLASPRPGHTPATRTVELTRSHAYGRLYVPDLGAVITRFYKLGLLEPQSSG